MSPTRRRSATRASRPSANSGLSVAPHAACAARSASPSNRPSSSAAARSKISSPIATPPRAAPSGDANTQSGRFWIGKSACALAEATQLRRAGKWVSSIIAVRSWLRAARIEVPAQVLPAVYIVVLPLLEVGRVFRQPLREPGLEHERHGVGELYRLELAVARMLESGLIRSVGQHAIVERDAAGHEALRFGVVDAVDEAHELRHQVAVIPGWPQGIFRHLPAFRE